MPKIQLLGDTDDTYRLLAVMLYPNHDAAREQFFAEKIARNAVVRADADGSEELHVSLDLLRALLEAPASSAMKADAQARYKRGFLAGSLLAMVYLMARLEVESEPSVNKAIFALSAFAQESEFADGTPIPHSERMNREG